MSDRLPHLPSLRALAAELRSLNEAWSHPEGGPEFAALTRLYDPDILGHRWQVRAVWSGDSEGFPQFGREWVSGAPGFDATGAARRLLAAARDAGYR